MDPTRIEQLRDPAAFPGNPETVEIIQTHLSVVCLAGEFAYKLKKSIRLPFADFTTIAKRRYFCEEELRLNRRLCPSIYLEVVPLCLDSGGRPRFRASGKIVDYALKMKRLPAERMLDVLLQQGAVSETEISQVAHIVDRFHERSERSEEIEQLGGPERLRGSAEANFEETRDMVGEVFCAELHAALDRRSRMDFDRWSPLLDQRRKEGRIVDGHGDLHARNICLCDPIAVYDCIEFEPSFRCGDAANDHAFLVMDLRFRGHPELSQAYVEAVIEESGDGGMRAILPFLVRYRALVRAKVSAFASCEKEFSGEERARSAVTASRYLRLAGASAFEESGPWWLVVCGLPGTGKSTLASELADVSGWPVVASDVIRKELAGVAPDERLSAPFYREEFSLRTYDELARRAAEATRANPVVILDANFRKRDQRERLREAAATARARIAFCELRLDEEMVRERLLRRSGDGGAVSDAGWAVYEKVKDSFEAIVPLESELLLTIDGGGDDECDRLLARLLAA